jgi:DNA repair ATPase RecN
MVRVSHLEGTVERSQELARMMGGAITEKAMARAEELLREAGSYVH